MVRFRPTRTVLLRGFLPLILVSYFGTLALAALLFPQPYDWRYRVISNLLSPRDDPRWFRLPSVGIAVAGLLMWPLAGYLEDRLRAVSPRGARVVQASLRAGLVLLVLSALVVPQHVHAVWGIPRLHEVLARASALGFAIAMSASCLSAWRDRCRARLLDARLLPCWSALTLLPLSGLLASEALLLAVHAFPRWAAPIKETMRHSVFWHLGFWEWIGSAAVYAFLALSVWLLPPSSEAGELPAARAADA